MVNGAPVVFKIIDNERVDTAVMEMLLRNELRALQSLDHPCILKTFAVERNQKETLIVCEYCEGGDLMENIKREGRLRDTQEPWTRTWRWTSWRRSRRA